VNLQLAFIDRCSPTCSGLLSLAIKQGGSPGFLELNHTFENDEFHADFLDDPKSWLRSR
jgi:hypothetical protein